MPVPPILIEALTLLSDALDDPTTNLQPTLDVLANDLTESIPMYLGLTIAVQVNEHQILADTLDRASEMIVASSLTLRLLPTGEPAPTGILIFYSAARGVFNAIARDVGWIFNLDGQPVVDDHVVSTAPVDLAIHARSERSDFDQAVRALVEEGHTQDQARAEIRRRATRFGITLPQAARILLAALKPES